MSMSTGLHRFRRAKPTIAFDSLTHKNVIGTSAFIHLIDGALDRLTQALLAAATSGYPSRENVELPQHFGIDEVRWKRRSERRERSLGEASKQGTRRGLQCLERRSGAVVR